jgi:hypothetical protein
MTRHPQAAHARLKQTIEAVLALLFGLVGGLWLLGLLGLLGLGGLGRLILREYRGGAYQQRQAKHQSHQFLHSSLLKILKDNPFFSSMIAAAHERPLKTLLK